MSPRWAREMRRAAGSRRDRGDGDRPRPPSRRAAVRAGATRPALGVDPETALLARAASVPGRGRSTGLTGAQPSRGPRGSARECPGRELTGGNLCAHRQTGATPTVSVIEQVIGREVLDSRGNPTVEVEVVLDSGAVGRAIVPSGASTGSLRGRGAARRRRAATAARASSTPSANVNGEIADVLDGLDALDQRAVDLAMIDARRHAQQGPARRQRHPRRLAGRGQGRGRRARAAALPLRRRRRRPRAAGADDERRQRRRATPTTRSTSRSS